MAMFILKKLGSKFYSPGDVLALSTDLFVDEISRRGWKSEIKCSYQDKNMTLSMSPDVKPNNLNAEDLSKIWNTPEMKEVLRQLQGIVKDLVDQVQTLVIPMKSIVNRRVQGAKSDIKNETKPPVGEVWAIICWTLLGRTIRIDVTVDVEAIQATRALPTWSDFADIPTSFRIPGIGQVKINDLMIDGETLVDAIKKIQDHLGARGWTGKMTILGGSLGVVEGDNGVAVRCTIPYRGAEGAPPAEESKSSLNQWTQFLHKPDIHKAVQESVKYYLGKKVEDSADLVEDAAVAFYGGSSEKPTGGIMEGENEIGVHGHGVHFQFEATIPSICSTRSFEERRKQSQYGWTSNAADYVEQQGGMTHLFQQAQQGVSNLYHQYVPSGSGGGAPQVRSRGFQPSTGPQGGGVVYEAPMRRTASFGDYPAPLQHSSAYTPSYQYLEPASHAYVPSSMAHQYEFSRQPQQFSGYHRQMY